MTLEEMGNLGEFLGAMAVIASLLYVGFQLRQSTLTTRAATRQAISNASQQTDLMVASNEPLARMLALANAGEPLEDFQKVQLGAFLNAYWRVMENGFYQHRAMLPKDEWASFRRNIQATMNRRPNRELWKRMSGQYTAEFVADIDPLVPPDDAPS